MIEKNLSKQRKGVVPQWQTERLKQIVDQKFNRNASDLARACEQVDGLSSRTHIQRISSYLTAGKTPGLNAASVIAAAADVSLDWLAGGDGPQDAVDQKDTDRVMIPLASVSVSAADGAEPLTTEIARYISYDREWVRRNLGVNPDRLTAITITGDSMIPTLQPGDRLLVARCEGKDMIMDRAIYILRHRYTGIAVKRLYATAGGTLQIRGDNDEAPVGEINLAAEDVEWQIVARALSVERVL